VKTYDVFVSYSHVDATWVRETLLMRLESHGFVICIDFRDFVGGSAGVEEMERCVLNSKRVLLVLTPHYIASEWSTFENIMAQTLDPAAVARKMVPVLREKCDLPLRLRILHYVDLRKEDEAAWDRLVRDLM
jgi:toll-like receptor 2